MYSRALLLGIMAITVIGCKSEKSEHRLSSESDTIASSQPVVSEEDYNEENHSQEDMTEEILSEISDVLSGSWMKGFDTIDGERDVSWGKVPYSNRYYVIIDLLNGTREIVIGASEGGRKGYDSTVGSIHKLERDGKLIYRFYYKNKIALNTNREHQIVIQYNPEKDSILFLEIHGAENPNPQELVRVSKPIKESS